MSQRAAPSDVQLFRQVWDSDVRSVVGRAFKWVMTIGVVGAVAAAGIGMWRFSDGVFDERFRVSAATAYDDARVASVGGATITFDLAGADDRVTRDGVFGIRWAGGAGTLGDVVSQADGYITRQFIPSAGALSEGRSVAVDVAVHHTDPLESLGIEFGEVDLPGLAGDLPTWFVPGTKSSWIVMLHDRGSGPEDGLRMLPALHEMGYPVLMVEYRNHGLAGDDPSGRYGYGLHEADDVEVAVRYALEQGADDVVLYGFGMGGSAALEFLHRSPFVVRISGVVLDSPLLDVGRTVELAAASRGVPEFLVNGAQTMAALRFGIRWSETNYAAKLEAVPVETLVINGTVNRELPPEVAAEFADLHADTVTYLTIRGAGHTEGWNVDRATYEASVSTFLAQLGRSRASVDDA